MVFGTIMVRVGKSEGVTTVILDRAKTRNAVDRQTAEALANALRASELDSEAPVAVLCGDNGTFCGPDLARGLKTFRGGRGKTRLVHVTSKYLRRKGHTTTLSVAMNGTG